MKTRKIFTVYQKRIINTTYYKIISGWWINRIIRELRKCFAVFLQALPVPRWNFTENNFHSRVNKIHSKQNKMLVDGNFCPPLKIVGFVA